MLNLLRALRPYRRRRGVHRCWTAEVDAEPFTGFEDASVDIEYFTAFRNRRELGTEEAQESQRDVSEMEIMLHYCGQLTAARFFIADRLKQSTSMRQVVDSNAESLTFFTSHKKTPTLGVA